ncbi:MAG: AbrB/MazE/SpoVT family DNA-binding domain-containing protein [Acidobacteriota bacterium]
MSTVTVSPKFQIVVPLEIRKALGLKPGQKIKVIQLGDRVELIPVRPLSDTRGLLRGIDTEVDRETDPS